MGSQELRKESENTRRCVVLVDLLRFDAGEYGY